LSIYKTPYMKGILIMSPGKTIFAIIFSILLSPLLLVAQVNVKQWEFDSDSDLQQWIPNQFLSNVVVKDSILSTDAAGPDPFFLCTDLSFPAHPWQYVLIRLRATRPGTCELFWTGKLDGKYGGLTQHKKLRFSVDRANTWQEIALFPFWHTEGTIRKLRFDLYADAHFDIDWIRILERKSNHPPTATDTWNLGGDTSSWQIAPNSSDLIAPPVNINVNDKAWTTVQLSSDHSEVAYILWARANAPGLQTQAFLVKGDSKVHTYNISMADSPAWRDNIIAFGLRPPPAANIRLESIHISPQPSGPGDLEIRYFGFENGVNRRGRPCRILAQLFNRGGSPQGIRSVQLTLPKEIKLLSKSNKLSHNGINPQETARFIWQVQADKAGSFPVRICFSGKGPLPPNQEKQLEFSEPPKVTKTSYVPVPRPTKTDIDICAYYYPGWNPAEKWDCIREVSPIRKPLLGYYDESNPECVDWQIKWAVENGISCFLVDWYWVSGHQQVTHWFDAYRKSRYRDYLKVAIMWANHNPPGTHSVEDWHNVTKHWIEHYFSLKSYYHIDGKPAVFIWNPAGITQDLGGSDIVAKTFTDSQNMARAAGYNGITYIALGTNFEHTYLQSLTREGYYGVTTYHEWGNTIDVGFLQKLYQFKEVVLQSPAAWREKDTAAGSLLYYPLVETGWDSRPWHGDKSMVIQGRTPQLFEKLLREAKSFCQENSKNILILGPVNEWGEGSYIEPCSEFGFQMLESIRKVFVPDDPAVHFQNIAPSDLGLGPYDYPHEVSPTVHK